MSFINQRLKLRPLVGFVGGPAWNTLKVGMANGRNRKKKTWSMPHHRYTANFVALNEDEKEHVLAAFMVCGGSFGSFRHRDPNDYKAIDQVFFVGDGTSSPAQLVKTYIFGDATLVRPITLPIGVSMTADGVPFSAATVDPLTGVVTPSGTWQQGVVYRWSGKFDVRVSFAEDFNPFTNAAMNVQEMTIELEEDFG